MKTKAIVSWLKGITVCLSAAACFCVQANRLSWNPTCLSDHFNQQLHACSLKPDELSCLDQVFDSYIKVFQGDFSSQLIFAQGVEQNGIEPQRIDAFINALWGVSVDCGNYDLGHGLQAVSMYKTKLDLGLIPAGKAEVKIKLNASTDINLQLYDGSSALLSGAEPSVINYKGMRINYSGYTGDEASAGNEYIQISGITSVPLQLQTSGSRSKDLLIANQWGIDPSLGATGIPNRQVFNELSAQGTYPGAVGTGEVKFVIKNIDTEFPSLYFMHSNHVPLHIDFVYDVLNWYPNLSYQQAYRAFSSSTYFLDNRQHLAGSIVAYDHFFNAETNIPGLYGLQLWPTDPVAPELIAKAYHLIGAHMAEADHKLVYFPASDIQANIVSNNEDYFTNNQVAIIDSESLFNNLSFGAMNPGEGYGTLRVVREGDPTPSVNDVVVFTYIPNDLAHVAGIITETPQTPLSHINLIARQNDTPNAYVKDATNDPAINALLNQLVHYQVTDNGFIIEAATQTDADAWLDSVRPANNQTPESDLSAREPARLDTLRHDDWISFGAKAANVAELAHVLEPGTYPVGYAIPFAMYDDFMQLNRCQGLEDDGITLDGKYRQLCINIDDPAGKSLYQQIQEIMSDEAFINSPDVRYQQLKNFRKEVKKSEVPQAMSNTLESIRYFWDPDGVFNHSIRLRSSTNNEDLTGFNGAGLYESNTHHPDEGDIADSVKKVWASLWTARAFEERRFYRIDHFKTYMGVLAHLSYGDEQANGVAVTKNIYDRNWEGYYVNVQYGEISVTNPEPIETPDGQVATVPDEFLLARLVSSDVDFSWVQQYIRHSNVEEVYDEPVPTENVLTDVEVLELRIAMQRIQNHFKAVYGGDENFAMDIEFKITRTDDRSRGHLEIKQARPWVD